VHHSTIARVLNALTSRDCRYESCFLDAPTTFTVFLRLLRLAKKVLTQSDYESGSDAFDDKNTILPSIEIEENLRVKQEIFRELFLSPAATLPTSVEDNSSTSPTHYKRPPSPTAADTSFTRTSTIATSATSQSTAAYSNNFDVSPPSCTTGTTVYDYDSDRTDFLSTSPSPCPGRQLKTPSRRNGLTSHFFDTSPVTNKRLPVRRKLMFNTVSAAKAKSTKMALLEYSPAHSWSTDERRFLCVLWRWFRRNIPAFATGFNATFDLTLSTRKI